MRARLKKPDPVVSVRCDRCWIAHPFTERWLTVDVFSPQPEYGRIHAAFSLSFCPGCAPGVERELRERRL